MTETGSTARRARILIRWYPRYWRERYGEEYLELLMADISERPSCWSRTADVVRSGLCVRLVAAGIAGESRSLDHGRAGLATLWSLTAVFFALGIAIWSRLLVGLQWHRPENVGMAGGLILMSAALVLVVVPALAAIVPMVWIAMVQAVRTRSLRIILPLVVALMSAAVLVLGCRYFSGWWPGTGGHRGLVPASIGAFSWALTLGISSYWAHPQALAHFPLKEVVWMATSPVALLGLVSGGAMVVRRCQVSRSVFRFELILAKASTAAMAVFVAGAWCWLSSGGSRYPHLFHPGLIDSASLGVMALGLIIATRLSYRPTCG